MRPTYAVINLSILKRNFLNIKKKAGNAKIMAVVKADAYGHGVERVVKSLNSLKKKPEYYAVAFSEEGVELRKLKVKQPVLIFEPVTANQAGKTLKYNLIPTVFTVDHIKILEKAKDLRKNKIKIQIKIDTGMHRLGISYLKAFDFIKKLSKNKNFIIDGIYTHFACSDEKDKKFSKLQLKRFTDLLIKLKKNKINYGLAHAANSGAILDIPESYFDIVRPGISLYGYYPSLETSESIPLEPVLSLISQAASVLEIEKGESVSYGRKFISNKKTKIISVPIGYADGFSRNLTNKATAIINGKIYKQVGRVTMDRIMFNINNDKIKTGDKVILLGKSKSGIKITAWDWSVILNTIPYEITCNISKRVPRIYLN